MLKQRFDVSLQPKQDEIRELVENSRAPWIGGGGGRGGAKSGCIDRVMLKRRYDLPGTLGAIVMRNYDQVKKYHIDVMLRDYPELEEYYNATDHRLLIPMPEGPPSEIHFLHADTLADVDRVFRSGNYYDIFVDQAEQFTETELRNMKQANRHKGTVPGKCKFGLFFNMAGAGIAFLDNIFHSRNYGPNEKASDFAFVHFYPWDNVEWVRGALEEDGLTEDDYYQVMTDAQRQAYCALRSDYGRNLTSQDTPLRNRDWLGSWESFEGAYFGQVFDRDATIISQHQVEALVKPYWRKWASQDWGFGHYCPTEWHASGEVSPLDAREVLGWNITQPVRMVITYREYIAGGAASKSLPTRAGQSHKEASKPRELSEQEIGEEICRRTPDEERPLQRFFLSPDAFDLSVRRAGQNQIAQTLGKALRDGGLPYPVKADNSRVSGWKLMFNMLNVTKKCGATKRPAMPAFTKGGDCWLISANCPYLIAAIPVLLRDPDNLDDVLKTDKNSAEIDQDMGDCARYGLKSMLSPGRKPQEQEIEDELKKISDPTARAVRHLQLQAKYRKMNQPLTRPRDWRARMEEQQ